jgi:hypothetical protein
MKSRWRIACLLVVACIFSGAIGYWFGFREALYFGVAADALPRGTIATIHLDAIRAGKTQNAVSVLEFDVDQGLIYGHDLFGHPLKKWVGPLWSFNFYPDYEQYAVRLANYRKKHPSLMKPEMFDTVPAGQEQLQEEYAELASGTRENVQKLDFMVKRYAAN